ncbi:MAG: phospholipid carrier-dependent glycosyltransferase [Caldilineaceae bacterium]|nr:phospholipid carrier-dependent glycosyltransferase [Caldilineaceae bacterium]
MKWNRRDWILLLSVTLLAAGLRFYQLGEVPPGFQFDEAFNAIDAEQIWYGNRPLFLPANGGREAFYSYFQALLGTFLGFHVYSLRLASALAGIATVAATYWLLRTILQRHARAIALGTSLTVAISFWHLHFSHYGIRVIMMPLILSGLFGCYWLALHAQSTRSRWGALIASGLLTGLTVWTHPSGRFVPFILVAYTAWLLWRYPQRRQWRPLEPLGVLVSTGVIAFLVFLPLGIEFYRHPDFFFGHASEVSIFAERVSGDAPWIALANNILHILGMFSFQGDMEWAHNLAGRPVFDPVLSLPFMIGVGLWLTRLWRRRPTDPDVDALALLACWSSVMVLPSVLSEAAPNYSRTLPALPALFVTVGLGLDWIITWVTQWQAQAPSQRGPAWLGTAIAGLLLVISGSWASYDFFVRFPKHPESYYAYDADKLDALRTLEALADQGYEVYLQPLWASHATFTFLRSSAQIQSLDTAATLVLPPVGMGAVYAFPGEKLDQAQALAAYWPGVAVEEVRDPYGKRLLALVKVEADLLTSWPAAYQAFQPAEARFDDGPTLLGMQSTSQSSDLVLFWRAEAKSLRSLTAFIHLIDSAGRRVAQIDKLPGNGSYLTPGWLPGERVIEHYQPELFDRCAGGETVDVVVGWYELAADGQRRPRLDGDGDTALAGQLVMPFTAYPPAEVAIPTPLELTLGPGLQLRGTALPSSPVQAGAPFSLDLYWTTHPALHEQTVTLQLLDGDDALPLWQGAMAPAMPWAEGELFCRRLPLTVPATLQPGNYHLTLTHDNVRETVTTLVVNP